MLDEGFIVLIYTLIIRIKCWFGIHGWKKFDNEFGENTLAASYVWDDATCIEFYECEDCKRRKMIWYDFWGFKHTFKLDKQFLKGN